MKKESIGYISGEPEGLGRKEAAEFKEEEERLLGGKRQSSSRRKKEAPGRKAAFTGGKEEISLDNAAEGDLISDELNPEQAFELKQAVKHGFADIAQNPQGEIVEKEPPKNLEELKRFTEEKERNLRNRRRKK